MFLRAGSWLHFFPPALGCYHQAWDIGLDSEQVVLVTAGAAHRAALLSRHCEPGWGGRLWTQDGLCGGMC